MNGHVAGRMGWWVGGRMDELNNGWVGGWTCSWTDGWMDGWVDEHVAGWMDGLNNGWMGLWMSSPHTAFILYFINNTQECDFSYHLFQSNNKQFNVHITQHCTTFT